MEQRRPRLGDTLDDYCPRERRITNHAVVAMIEDEIKQTRCVTCDAEHPYKAAKVPPRRKKPDAPGALYKQVLAGLPETGAGAPGDAPTGAAAGLTPGSEARGRPVPAPEAPAEAIASPAPDEPQAIIAPTEDGPVRRPLIRATLPRPEGPVTRPAPEFTVRQTPGREGYRDSRVPPKNGGRPFGSAGRGRTDRPGRPFRAGNRPAHPSQESGHRGTGRPPQARHRPHASGRFGKKRSR